MSIDLWAGFAALVGAVTAVISTTAAMFAAVANRLDRRFDTLEARLDGYRVKLRQDNHILRSGLTTQIGDLCSELKTEMRQGFDEVDARLVTLEERTYDLSTRLPPAPTRSSS